MLVLLLALASVACLAAGVHYLRQALAVTGTATSYIRSAAQGYVVLVGEGIPPPGHPMLAPFSGTPCVWWSTQVETTLVGGVGGEPVAASGDAFNKHFSKGPFLLRDGSGQCLVDPDSADVQVKSRDIWYGSSLSGGSVAHSHRTRGIADDLRFVEERIELHQRIMVRGYFRTAHADTSPTVTPTAAPGTNVLGPPPDGRQFLISTVSEDILAKGLRLRAAAILLLCVALGICAVLAGRAV
ncbi:MAG TPA: GIDE domain-containing protein [Gammaproteobacteria bacterium]